jgi:uncharacterized membrane protein YdjX (TVP38/TMEM64 family)
VGGVGRSKVIVLFLLVLALPLLWRWTPLHEWINLESILAWQRSIRTHPAAPLFVVAAYIVGSLFFFPITILNLATVFAYGAVWGNLYAFAGWLASASVGYFIGRLIGKDLLHKLTGDRIGRFIDQAERHGFWTVMALRVVPAGPFTLVNLFIGASGIRFRDFFLASTVGRLPGILTLTLFGVQLEYALRRPGLTSLALLMVALFVVPLGVAYLVRRVAASQSH